jgi:probable phosphoglycerate mutase
MELLLIRHAQPETVILAEGPADPGLLPEGEKQALLLARVMADEQLDALYSSPLRRAAETARPISRSTGLEVRWDEGLAEADRGSRTYIPMEELRRANDERLWALVRQGSGHSTPEDRARFRRGAVDTVERLIAAHPGQRIAAVTHGGVINAYLSHILELGARDVFEPRYTGVARILASRAGHRNIDSLNETHHLPRSWLK